MRLTVLSAYYAYNTVHSVKYSSLLYIMIMLLLATVYTVLTPCHRVLVRGCCAPTPNAALMQGTNRLQRGLIYMDYLRAFSNFKQSPNVVVVPNMGHAQGPMLNSPEFIKFLTV